ncbi:dienelactone hydrolase, partial [Blyttiomyces helicus]
GFLVVMPDLFDKKPLDNEVMPLFEALEAPSTSAEEKASLMAAIMVKAGPFMAANDYAAKLPLVSKVLTVVHTLHSPKSISLSGYCFGGKVAVLASSSPLCHPHIAAAACAHPAKAALSDWAAMKIPFLFNHAGSDFSFTTDDLGEATEAMEKAGVVHEVVVYEGMKHGFTTKGDVGDQTVVKERRRALEVTAGWFRKHSGGK